MSRTDRHAETAFAEIETLDLAGVVAAEADLPIAGVRAALALLDDACTVPFIARYRKEATGGLDEVAIETICDRSRHHRELLDRKRTVLSTIAEQGALTAELRDAIVTCTTRTALEDLYAPFKPRRRTRGSIAIERGLEPLADRMWRVREAGSDDPVDPLEVAAAYVDPARDVPTAEDALAGARDIVAERIANTAALRAAVRDLTWESGHLRCAAARGKKDQTSKFQDYYDFTQPVRDVPPHRVLAIRRGEKEGFLTYRIRPDENRARELVRSRVITNRGSAWRDTLRTACDDAYDRLLSVQVETDVRTAIRETAEASAIDVFASNLRELLLSPPFGARPVIGVDPGFRTGCKLAVLDATGKLVAHGVVHPVEPRSDVHGTTRALVRWIDAHDVAAVAVGNGTAGRETFAIVRRALAEVRPDVGVVLVNESGASVYSASAIAREELPDVDLTVRGAVSIGRRLQDPLAELVKIDPRSIGVGQYQHDVDPKSLRERLGSVVSSSVNHVGVDVNTASASLLRHVSGLGPSVAGAIVSHRDAHGAFASRSALMKVPRLGDKTFEQAAGFLRVRGENPLDASAVHPERYALVERIAADLGTPVAELVGNAGLAARIDVGRYVDDAVGRYTLDDIVAELERPGRDPRHDFDPVAFRDDVTCLEDLAEGMDLAGVVTNVTHFGAFVDVGVHQDGLVHVSEIAHRFVRDPSDELRVGQRVDVRVIGVDRARDRIALSIKARRPAPANADRARERRHDGR